MTGTSTMTSTETGTTELSDFDELTKRYQRELLAHCYRMTGSVHEAEDLVQETLLRAWKAQAGYEGRASVRTWLYRIATNVCLTNLEGKPRRPMPTGLGTSSSDAHDPLETSTEIPWLEPIPDAAVLVGEKDTIRLAFVAALQQLPARQRAVLILRDVLRWSAKETAEALDTTTAAVNSALQRAHAQLEGTQEDGVSADDLTDRHKALLEQYVEAFWRKDIDSIVSLLKADAIWEMPPFTGWYEGAANIGELIRSQCPGGTYDMPMLETRGKGLPADGVYMRAADGSFVPFQLQVLTLGEDRVEHVHCFQGPQFFERFGLPSSLPPRPAPCGAEPAGA